MEISSENTSFSYLRGSPDFLNEVLNSITSCVMLLDREMKLQAFNDAMRTTFSNSPEEHLLYLKCGNAIGCAVTVENMADCGTTSECCHCQLRKAALMTYSDGVEYYKNRIERDFLLKNGEKVSKHLQFSTRSISFNQDRYVLLVIDDLTEIVAKEGLIADQNRLIEKLRAEL